MRAKFLLTASFSLLLPVYSAFAVPIGTVNQLIAFGDSLSDSGNASIATKGTQPPSSNYYFRNVPGITLPVGEFTNAPTATGPTGVWADQFAAKLGSPDQPFLAGGSNYAIGSAQTGSNGLSGVTDQLGYFNAAHNSIAPGNALYSFWAGANDIGAGKNPITAADNLYNNILTLSGEGAKYFLWFNEPDLGKTPAAIAAGPVIASEASLASAAFDGEWAADIHKLQAQGVYIVGVDVATLFGEVEANPAAFGFTNVTTPAMDVPGANPDKYLFFDQDHPTAAADALIADLAFSDFAAAPEPAAFGFALIGISGLCLARLKARRSSRR